MLLLGHALFLPLELGSLLRQYILCAHHAGRLHADLCSIFEATGLAHQLRSGSCFFRFGLFRLLGLAALLARGRFFFGLHVRSRFEWFPEPHLRWQCCYWGFSHLPYILGHRQRGLLDRLRCRAWLGQRFHKRLLCLSDQRRLLKRRGHRFHKRRLRLLDQLRLFECLGDGFCLRSLFFMQYRWGPAPLAPRFQNGDLGLGFLQGDGGRGVRVGVEHRLFHALRLRSLLFMQCRWGPAPRAPRFQIGDLGLGFLQRDGGRGIRVGVKQLFLGTVRLRRFCRVQCWWALAPLKLFQQGLCFRFLLYE